MNHTCMTMVACDIEERMQEAIDLLHQAERREADGGPLENDHVAEKLIAAQTVLGGVRMDIEHLMGKPMHRRFEVEK